MAWTAQGYVYNKAGSPLVGLTVNAYRIDTGALAGTTTTVGSTAGPPPKGAGYWSIGSLSESLEYRIEIIYTSSQKLIRSRFSAEMGDLVVHDMAVLPETTYQAGTLLSARYAPKASPTFTGTATIPTAAVTNLTVSTAAALPSGSTVGGDAVDTRFVRKNLASSQTLSGALVVPGITSSNGLTVNSAVATLNAGLTVVGAVGVTGNVTASGTVQGHTLVGTTAATLPSGTTVAGDAIDTRYVRKNDTGAQTISGELAVPKITLTETGDLSLAGDAHAFQIGATSGNNIAIDTNEIMARNNGAASSLRLNEDGGPVLANGSEVLTTADEGAGNGLDADTVDGYHASTFPRFTSGSYAGNGVDNRTLLNLGYVPRLIIIMSANAFGSQTWHLFRSAGGALGSLKVDAAGGVNVASTTFVNNNTGAALRVGNDVNDDPNVNGATYYWHAFGVA